MISRPAEWKRRFLSKGGHIVLLRSTLASLPVYFLSLFVIPTSVAEFIKCTMKDFYGAGVVIIAKFALLLEKKYAFLEGGGTGVLTYSLLEGHKPLTERVGVLGRRNNQDKGSW